MLLIGVGGSGGKTLQLLHRELRWRLRDAGWNEGVPVGWQFVHVDVPIPPDTELPDEAYLVSSAVVGGGYAGLMPPAVNYRAVDDVWLAGATTPELTKTATWRPRAEDVAVNINAGAGQFRGLGRVIALARAKQIRQSLNTANTRLTDPTVQPQLKRLTAHLGAEAAANDVSPQAVIVSSMAGGSGAGMFLDVADILRSFDPNAWYDRSIGILYTADVFEDIDPLSKSGVMPNSLATLCEMMNGCWNNTQPGPEYAALERAGINAAAFERRGVRYPFMVGRSNNNVNFKDQLSVYLASAKTLAAFMTSPAAQTSIGAYLQGNWEQSALGMTDHTPFKDSSKGTVVSGMGMGSLSLGRDRFARYTAQRLARAAVEHALRAHTVGRKVPEEITFDGARDEAAVAQFAWFVNECQLDEIGEDRNQVLDALRPTGTESEDAVRASIRSHISQFAQAQPREYGGMIIQHAEHHRPSYVSSTDQAMRQRAADWVEHIVATVESVTLESLSRSGLDVTAELMRRIIDHVGDVINDLNTEVSKYQSYESQMSEGVYGALQDWGAAAMTSNNEALEKATGRAVKALTFGLEARLRRTACELLDDLARNELVPLHKALLHALGALRSDEHPPTGHPIVGIENWPTATIIPQSLYPALNERLVEEVESFPSAYESQLSATVRRGDDPNSVLGSAEAERVAVGELLTGRGRDMSVGEVLVRRGSWWPQLLASQRAAAPAQYELRFGGQDILDRAAEWTHRRDTALGEYVHESLRSYLAAEDPQVQAQRRARVLGAFQEVLAVSPPLVSISEVLAGAVHGATPTTQFHFTAVPFAQTDLEPELMAIARAAGMSETATDRLARSFGTGDEQQIEIITTLGAPVQPVVLRSVLDPIASQWGVSRSTPSERDKFWRWRRSRALPEFLPFSPDVVGMMVRGWFLGRLLGDVTYDKAAVDQGPVEVFDPEFQTKVQFPFPYVGPSLSSEQDLLPAVLESTGVAMLDCQIQGNVKPLRAYSLVRNLGEQAPLYIRNWIQFGRTANGTTPMDRAWKSAGSELASATEALPADRQAAVVGYLNGRLRSYVERLDLEPVSKATLDTQPRWLDLRDQLESAFTSMIIDASNTQVHDVDDGGD
ncbi:MAG: tubulin-like doman-containing protein [Microthrixaceae bacterium]|nr:tubulin-like doman-containing protein [Microthrixaceae bacterium]